MPLSARRSCRGYARTALPLPSLLLPLRHSESVFVERLWFGVGGEKFRLRLWLGDAQRDGKRVRFRPFYAGDQVVEHVAFVHFLYLPTGGDWSAYPGTSKLCQDGAVSG